MQSASYLAVLRKDWWIVVGTTALLMLIVGVISFTATPIYTSTASVFASLPFGKSAGELFQGSTYVQGQMQSYAELVEMPVVLQPVIDELRLDTTPEVLARDVTATTSGESVILAISASSPDPQRAAAIANATALSLSKAAQLLAPKQENGQPSVRIDLVEPAEPPQFQSSPDKRRNLASALIAGLILGSGVAFARRTLDTRLNSVQQVESETGLPVLGEIWSDANATPASVVMRDAPTSLLAEGYRRLRVNLQFLDVSHRPLVCAITSARPGEGKTTISVNLAFACAQAGDRVLLIDADLRKPAVDRALGLVQGAGLTTVLAGRATIADVLQTAGSDTRIDVLTSGQIPPNPAELVGSPAMAALLDAARAQYDVIIVDSPPLLPVVDAALLAGQASGAIIVARLDRIRRGDVTKANAQLDQARARALGVVVNGVRPRAGSGYAYAYGEGGAER